MCRYFMQFCFVLGSAGRLPRLLYVFKFQLFPGHDTTNARSGWQVSSHAGACLCRQGREVGRESALSGDGSRPR